MATKMLLATLCALPAAAQAQVAPPAAGDPGDTARPADADGQGQLTAELSVLHDVTSVSKGAARFRPAVLHRARQRPLERQRRREHHLRRRQVPAHLFRRHAGRLGPVRSGLAAYCPKSGLRDAGGGVTAGYQLGGRWGLLARAGYTRLVDQAGKSPIARAGPRNQLLGGVALSYRF